MVSLSHLELTVYMLIGFYGLSYIIDQSVCKISLWEVGRVFSHLNGTKIFLSKMFVFFFPLSPRDDIVAAHFPF